MSGNPLALFERLMKPWVEPLPNPPHQSKGTPADPESLTKAQIKSFFKDFQAGQFTKAAENIFKSSPSRSYAANNEDLRKKCDGFFSLFPAGSPEYIDAMRPESIKWNNSSELLSSLDLSG